MLKKKDNVSTPPEPFKKLVFPDLDVAKARKWFEKGQELAEKKNYDYAIESYINGLGFWPEAVEEGHKPCRAAALFRGPKKVGFTDSMKYKTGGKDYKKAMLNAEMLLSKDPANVGYMDSMFKCAAKGQFDQTAMWIGQILGEAAAHEAKPSLERWAGIREVYEEIGDRNTLVDPALAIAAYEKAVEALSQMQRLKPGDMEITTDLRDVAGKVTILKGKYQSADSFRDSVRDSEGQRELHDKERLFQSEDRVSQIISNARQRYERDPTDRIAINELVDGLVRRETAEAENEAIQILTQAAKETNEYRFKSRADDLRIRQLKRDARQVIADGNAEAAGKFRQKLLEYELAVFKERTEHYPTDMRLKYHLGVRLFQARRFDDAIPVLQEARTDPKARSHCSLYIGRCFFEKGYFSQAIETLEEAIRGYEIPDDDLGKDMNWRLALAYESDGRVDDALKVLGQLIQWDYNFRNGEARQRLDRLKARKAGS